MYSEHYIALCMHAERVGILNYYTRTVSTVARDPREQGEEQLLPPTAQYFDLNLEGIGK